MKVSFTPKEFARLLELVYFGRLVVAGTPGKEPTHLPRYREIEQKLLDLASVFGCEELVTVGSDGGLTYSERVIDDERVQKIYGEYTNDTFWHELVNRLADRDLAAEQARQLLKDKDLPPINADARLREIEDAYWSEFEKHDLAKVILLRGGKG